MKKNLFIIMLIIAIVLCGSVSFAKKYSAAPSGQGSSTIGSGGDYASLYEAALDFNATPNTGNWTVQILNNLSEISVACFGNYVPSSNTITIKPAPSANPVVTFAETTTENGAVFYGQFLVGINNNITAAANLVSTNSIFTVNNFVIDGSNNGTNSRNLTFLRPDNYVGFNYMFHIIGSPGFTMQNCNVFNRYATQTTASGATTAFTGYCFYMDIDVLATGVDLNPDGFKIINNYIECTAGDNFYQDSRCMYIGNNIGAALTNGTDHMPQNWVISGNTFLAGNRTVWFYRNGSGTFSNNSVITIHHEPGVGPGTFAIQGGVPIGLWLGYNNGGQNGPLDGSGHQATVNIYGNYFLTYTDETAGGYSAVGIGLDGLYNVYNVYNNEIITKYNGTLSCATQSLYGIDAPVINALTGCVLNIYNNSINIPNNSLLTNSGSVGRWVYGIYDASAAAHTLTLENNLIRIDQIGASYAYTVYSTNAVSGLTTVCDYNSIFVDTTAGNVPARLAGLSDYSTFASWTSNGTGYDAHGQFQDPFTTSPSAWISPTDLHFNRYVALNGSPNPSVGAAPLTAGITIPLVTTDIDGQTRTAPWKGCDELFTSPFVTPGGPLYTQPGAAIQFAVAGGVSPYTWAVNSTVLGSLNTSSGLTVTFTAGSTLYAGTVTVTDSSSPTAQSSVVSISVIPTSAPLTQESNVIPVNRKSVIRFDLFE